METHSNKHFRRFEFKYQIPRAIADRVVPQLLNYMVVDQNASDDGGYFVSSLYFDSRRLKCYHEKVDGLVNRKKLRLRTYGLDNESAGDFFFEIKRRSGVVVLKDREVISFDQLGRFFNDFHGFLESEDLSSDFWQELIVEKLRYDLKPKMWVGYFRRPFFSKFDSRFRVTFDYDIKFSAVKDCFERPVYQKSVDDFVIMEVKFNGALPAWFQDVVEVFKLNKGSFSKYCYCIEACHGEPNLF